MTETSMMAAITTPSRWGLVRVREWWGVPRTTSSQVVLRGDRVQLLDRMGPDEGVYCFLYRVNGRVWLEARGGKCFSVTPEKERDSL